MITDAVIQEIYKTHKKPPKDLNDLNLHEAIYELRGHHSMTLDSEDLSRAEVIINDVEDFNPFRRFLVRGLYAILPFDRQIAFVFRSHILFLNKEDDGMNVHFRPSDEDEDEDDDRGWFRKLLGL
ncbi:MAG: hypothetical protein HDS23_00910 [Bacteroides sp.]|nr:hypothetical protein [Bacteroidales bacterium]MBD5291799.1 hypothetical protein [Bacteroides sp.]MBD5338858.1 hypothetical protein [Bacteroides sp.]MDE6806625.1 hypothetical protein [Muribaculaceae bacterium]